MPRIRLGLCSSDSDYIARLVDALNKRYDSKLEIMTYTSFDNLNEKLNAGHPNVVIADPEVVRGLELTGRCALAVFSDDASIRTIDDVRAICKYQSVNDIYSTINMMYADVNDNVTFGRGEKKTSIVLFASTGSVKTEPAAAFAMHAAARGKSVLYFSLRLLDASELYFGGESAFTFDDLLYKIKSGNTSSLALTLDSCVFKSQGVDVILPCINPLDVLSITVDNITKIFTELAETGRYDIITAEIDFGLDEKFEKAAALSDYVILTTDGSAVTNLRMRKLAAAVPVWEGAERADLAQKLMLLYCQDGAACTPDTSIEISVLDRMPAYAGSDTADTLRRMAEFGGFSKLL